MIIKVNEYIQTGLTEDDFNKLTSIFDTHILNTEDKDVIIDFTKVKYFTTSFVEPFLFKLHNTNCKLINLSNYGKKIMQDIIDYRHYQSIIIE